MSDAAIVSVRVSIKGQRSKQARIDKDTLEDLIWGGFTNSWFLGSQGDHILTRTPEGKVIPVWCLTMKSTKGKLVSYKDGDPFNLTRDNLMLVKPGVTHG